MDPTETSAASASSSMRTPRYPAGANAASAASRICSRVRARRRDIRGDAGELVVALTGKIVVQFKSERTCKFRRRRSLSCPGSRSQGGSMSERCDVVVIGSRLAGACAAAHLAMAGKKVVALDRLTFPSDQLSTHLLFPAGVDELRRMGALDGILASNPTKSPWLSLNTVLPTGQKTSVLERWRACGPIEYCMCVPRPIQDVELVNAARAAGADVRERHRFVDVIWRGGRAVGVRYADPKGAEHELHADLVLGADGRRSSVAAAVGAFKPYRASRNGRGLVFRYADDPMVGTREGATIYQWRDQESFGFLFPSAPSPKMLMLFMGAAEEATEAKKDPEGYWARKLARHPAMAERVRGHQPAAGHRRHLGLLPRLQRARLGADRGCRPLQGPGHRAGAAGRAVVGAAAGRDGHAGAGRPGGDRRGAALLGARARCRVPALLPLRQHGDRRQAGVPGARRDRPADRALGRARHRGRVRSGPHHHPGAHRPPAGHRPGRRAGTGDRGLRPGGHGALGGG